MGSVRKSYPRFRREGDAPSIELTEDDASILRIVYRHRFIRAEDIYRLFESRSPDRLSRRLAHLYRNRYLDRPIAQVDRYREGGSRSLVYGLDTAGARYLKKALGVPIRSADWQARNRSYTRENLDHTLNVTRFLVDLELICRRSKGAELIAFEEILAAAPEHTRRLPQAGRWQVPVRWRGDAANVLIVPDAIFGLRVAQQDGRKLRSFVFLEIDRGTMTIVPAKQVRESSAFLHRTSMLRKMLTYAASYHLQLHREHLSLPNARVLTLTTSAARAEAMKTACAEMVVRPLGVPPGLFLFGTYTPEVDLLTEEFADAAGRSVRLAG